MALMAAGLAFTTGPATDAIMGALPAGKAGAGSAVNDTTREVGGTLGVAIVGSVLNSAYGAHVLHGLVSLGAPASVGRVAGQSVVAGMTAASHFPAPLRAAAVDAVSSAFMVGLHRGSFVAACAVAVAALVALVFLPARAAAIGVDRAAGAERADEAAAAVAAGAGSGDGAPRTDGAVPAGGASAARGGRSSFARTHAAYSDSSAAPAKS
jgi:hypothetical protein